MMRLTRLADQRLNRHGDGEIGLAGAGGTDAEDQIVALDGFEIAALRDGFGRENLLAETALLAAVDQRAKRDFGIGGDDAQQAVEIAVLEDLAFADEREVVLEDSLGAGHVVGLAFDFDGVAAEFRADVQAGFDEPDVFIAGTEEALDASADLHAGFHLVGTRPPGNDVGINDCRKRNIKSDW